MKDIQEVKLRIGEINFRLEKIRNGMQKQLDLPFFERDRAVCGFLDLEKRIYEGILKELNWVINE